MKSSMPKDRDCAIAKAEKKQSQNKAFQAYQKMAEYLDNNFSPVTAIPQVTLYPFTERTYRNDKTVCYQWAKNR